MRGSRETAARAEPTARLFAEYGEQLYRFCLARLGSREDAEDAVQSTFLRAHRALARGVVPEHEAGWLFTIAQNLCLSRRAALARRPRLVPLDGHELPAPEAQHDELLRLPDALAALPANLRRAVVLREWIGLSYREIANVMGSTVSAVETLLFRGRRDLAAALSGEQPRRRGLVDVAGLVARLLAAAPAKLAAGAAIVAIGGAGVGTAIELGAGGAAPSRGQSRGPAIEGAAVQPRPVPGQTRPARRAAAHRSTPARPRTTAPAPPASARGTAPTAAPEPAAHRPPPAQPPDRTAAPAAAPAPEPAPTTTTAAVATAPAATATVGTAAVGATVPVPALPVPTAQLSTSVTATTPVATVTVTATVPALP